MKSKHHVNYLIAAMAVSLFTSFTLSATEKNKTSVVETNTTTVETVTPITFVESTDEVGIPELAEPKVLADDNSGKSNNKNNESEQLLETESANDTMLIEAMPVITNKDNSYIPLIEGATIFANYSDELPAMVNYYTQTSEQEVIAFYQQSFGDAISTERKRGRLTLIYQVDDLIKRVVISQQNNKRQVDVIVEQAVK